jgi:mono/diheme cytochrome c family protein
MFNNNLVLRVLLGVALVWNASVVLAADDAQRSGKELYERYCASCHGVSGRGDGPVSKSLTVEVPDITRYADRHGGFFDREFVERIIDGRHVIAAHGTRTMPVWGEAFSLARLGDPDAERAARLQIVRLADYVWQLQHRAQPADEH